MITRITAILLLVSSVVHAQGVSLPGANFPTCNANNDAREVIITDPVDDGQCGPPGLGTANPHVCICDGTTSTWRADFPDNHELVVVDASGDVGIGIAVPIARLHVKTTGAADVRIESTSNDSTVRLMEDGATKGMLAWDTSESVIRVGQGAAVNIIAGVSIDSFGKVGIGSTNPNASLHVVDLTATATVLVESQAANSIARVGVENDALRWDIRVNSSDDFQIRDDTNSKNVVTIEDGAPADSLFIDSSGNVGIGTASPDSDLHVIGGLCVENTDTACAVSSGDTRFLGLMSHGVAALPPLGVAVTTFAVSGNILTLIGDGGGNTIATITGAASGAVVHLLFTDANITITDDNTHAADSVDLAATFTSADDTVLGLLYDGTSWYETSRSVN